MESAIHTAIRVFLLCCALSSGVPSGDEEGNIEYPTETPRMWDFENGLQGWKPRAATVEVERVTQPGATTGSRAYLRVHGRMEENWNHAVSDSVPLQAGQLHRLSAWVKVVSIGATTPMPFLRCEFLAADRRREMGRASTDLYSAANHEQWQRLTAEFQAPDGPVSGWLALEKGASDPTQIDAYLDDVTVEPIEQLTVLARYDMSSIPAALEKVRGVHPRLYPTAERLAQLRQAIQTTHADLWAEVKALADGAVRQGAPQYRADDGRSGDEQLWQREVGNTMPHLAMACLMTSGKRYLDAAEQWMLASCDYATWSEVKHIGLAKGEHAWTFTAADKELVFDWRTGQAVQQP